MSFPDFVWEELEATEASFFELRANYSPSTEDIVRMVAVLNEKKSITELRLVNCDLDDKKIAPLAKLRFVTNIDLRNNDIQDPSKLLEIVQLQSLNLDTNNLSKDSLDVIVGNSELLQCVAQIELSAESNDRWEGYKEIIEKLESLRQSSAISCDATLFTTTRPQAASVTETRRNSDSDVDLNTSGSSEENSSDEEGVEGKDSKNEKAKIKSPPESKFSQAVVRGPG